MKMKPDRLNETWTKSSPRYSDESAMSTMVHRSATGPKSKFTLIDAIIFYAAILCLMVAPGITFILISPHIELLAILFAPLGLGLLYGAYHCTLIVYRKYKER
ncbi:MAG: hypothetical protein AAFY98_01555 [Verrucomicrobiota bacterium]